MKLWKVCAVTFVVVAPLVFWVFDRSPVIDYGPPGSVYLTPTEVSPGDTIEIHFDHVTWYRNCPLFFRYYIIDSAGRRSDYEPHHTHPAKLGLVEPKWREFHVPNLPKGEARVYAWANAECLPLGYWWPISTPLLPAMRLVVK